MVANQAQSPGTCDRIFSGHISSWSAGSRPAGSADAQPSVGESVSLLREPDAGSLHVRFDERDVETEHGTAIEAPADERAGTNRPNLNHRATSRLYRLILLHEQVDLTSTSC